MTADGLPPRGRAARNAWEVAHPPSNAAEAEAREIRRRHPGDDPRPAVAEMLAALGHVGGQVVPTVSGARWFAYCACGFVTTTRPSEEDAYGALVHHLRLALRAWRTTGLPLAATRPAPPPNWARVIRRHPHLAAALRDTPEQLPGLDVPHLRRLVG